MCWNKTTVDNVSFRPSTSRKGGRDWRIHAQCFFQTSVEVRESSCYSVKGDV